MNIKYLFLLSFLFGLGGVVPAVAQNYPNKTVRILVGFAPGGSTDIVARLIAQEMTKNVGQQVVVDNRPGAGGNIAAELVSKAPPDGYTLHACTTGVFAIQPFLYSKLPYDPDKDLVPVARLFVSSYVVAVNTMVPANTLKELIDAAKKSPGTINWAIPGTGTSQLYLILRPTNISGFVLYLTADGHNSA